MQIARKQPARPQIAHRNTALALLLAVALWLALALFTRASVGEQFGLRTDFTPSLIAAHVLREGGSPYTPEVTARIQQAMFGSQLPEGEDQQRVAHPAYTAVVLLPFTFVAEETAIALWSSLQLVLLIATPFIWMNIIGWSPRPWVTAVILLSSLFLFRYPMMTYVLGQFVGTVVFGFSLAIWSLRRGRPLAAGLALVLCMMPPSFGVFLVALALLPEIARGRWRAALVFVGVMALLTLITFLRIGWWIPDWLATLNAYREYANPYLPLAPLPLAVQIALAVAIVALSARMVWRWWRAPSDAHWQDALCAAILALMLLLPQTGSYYLSVLLIVAVIAAPRLIRKGRLAWMGLAVWVACMALPWLLYLLPRRDLTEVLLMPLVIGVLWLYGRRFTAA